MLAFSFIFLLCIVNVTSFLSSLRRSERCCSSIDECFDSRISFPVIPRPHCPEGEFAPKYELWTRAHGSSGTVFTLDDVPVDLFQEDEKVIFIVHGWLNDNERGWSIKMQVEFLKKENARVILVNWEKMTITPVYYKTVSDTRTAGAHIAKVIEKIKASRREAPYVWCIGYSIGAHACQQVARRTHLDRLTALDPAGPYFKSASLPEFIFRKEAADFVDVVHAEELLGTFEPLGHADFYVNGGKRQPDCAAVNRLCSHDYAVSFFTDSINHPCFEAKKCERLEDWSSCQESSQNMGYSANPQHHGIFYIETPHCIS